MSSYINEDLRLQVAERADFLCEYCLIHENDTFFQCQVDHIISLKHNGLTQPANLAYSCAFCNRNKGSDVGSVLLPSNDFIRFFNPRTDLWSDHFSLEGAEIVPLTNIGIVTAQILGFNNPDRILERQTLILTGRYPSGAAKERMEPGAPTP